MAKKKAPAKRPAKTSEKTKKLATPKSSVRVRPKVATKTQSQGGYNALQTWKTEQAASGNAARQEAKRIKIQNDGNTLKGKPKRVIKIRSGGAGLGGMFGVKNR